MHYLVRLPRQLRALYSTQVIRQLGVSLVDFFGVMFVYELSQNLTVTISIYGVLFAGYMLILPAVAKLYGYLSRRRLMAWGLIFLALSYIPFILIPDQLWYTLALYIGLQILFRALFWLPFHVSIAQMVDGAARGRTMGVLNTFSSLVLGVAPLISGYLISQFGFSTMFAVGIFVILIAIIPLWQVPHYQGDHFEWPWRGAFGKLVQKQNRRLLLSHAAAGANQLTRIVFWPLFIFFVLDGQYETIGLLSTLALLAVLALRFVTGALLDNPRTKDIIIHWTARLQSLTWVLRSLPVTSIQVFLADTSYRLVESMNNLSYDKVVYDHIGDAGDHADEYTVIRATAINLGRILMLVGGLAITIWWDIRYTFLLAAVFTLLMNRVQREAKVI